MKTVKVFAVIALTAFGLTSCSNNSTETNEVATTDSTTVDSTDVIIINNDAEPLNPKSGNDVSTNHPL